MKKMPPNPSTPRDLSAHGDDDAFPSTHEVRMTAWVHGRVQHVGFRWWVRGQALELGLAGSATNYPDGRVLVVAQGNGQAVEALEEKLRETPSTTRRPGEVTAVVVHYGPPKTVRGFAIR